MLELIVNPTSGSGAGLKLYNGSIKPYLKNKNLNCNIHMPENAEENKALVRRITAGDDPRLIIVGGDGTINKVINSVTDFKRTRIGFIPAGSGNDFTGGLQLEKDPVKALENILTQKPTPVDLGKVYYEDKSLLFSISSGLGIDAAVCHAVSKSGLKKVLNRIGLGSATYGLLTFKLLFTHPMAKVRLTVKHDGITETEKLRRTYFMMAMNLPYEGGHVPMAPPASGTDNKLTAVWLDSLKRTEVLGSFIKILNNRHDAIAGYTMRPVDELIFRSDIPLTLHADGEVLGQYTSVKMKCLPGKLNVLGLHCNSEQSEES